MERSIEEYIIPIDFSEKPLEIKRMDIKNGYKKWIFKILDIRKVLALMIAGILWYYVYNLEQSIEEYIVPIDFSEKPLEIKKMDIKNGYSRYWT